MTGCWILTRRRTLAQGEAKRQPLPLPSPVLDPHQGAEFHLIKIKRNSATALDPHQDAQQRGHRAHALRILAAESYQAASPGKSERRTVTGCGDPPQAAHVGPGRSAAAALASSLPALDPHQDAQQRGHRAHALRILAAEIFQAAAPGRSERRPCPAAGSSPGGAR